MQLQCEWPNNSQCSQSSVVPDMASCCLIDSPPKNAILRPLHKNFAVEFKWEKGFSNHILDKVKKKLISTLSSWDSTTLTMTNIPWLLTVCVMCIWHVLSNPTLPASHYLPLPAVIYPNSIDTSSGSIEPDSRVYVLNPCTNDLN